MAFSVVEQIVLIVFLMASVGYFGYQVVRRVRLVRAGANDTKTQSPAKAMGRLISEVLFQSKVIKDRPLAGLLHALVFWGFIAYAGVTISHFLLPFGSGFLDGSLGEGYKLFVYVFSFLVLVSILGLAFRRFVTPPGYFEKKTSITSAVVAALISVLMITYMLEPFLSGMAAKANWWVHSLSILWFLIIIPSSKHLHLVFGPVNLASMRGTFGELPALNIEELTEDSVLGVGSVADMSWKMRLDAFSCVECGRCTEYCPANLSDKTLDPRALIHNLEEPLLAGKHGSIFDGIVSSEDVWQCVTCGACETFCPLGIQHLPLIQQYRRNLTLEQTIIPEQMINTFKSLRNKGNVWNKDRQERAEKLEELGLPLHQKGQMLFWSSCFFLTDEAGPKIKMYAKLLQDAGLEAGFSPLEVCCGDPARKCGSEDLFQELALENIEWMKRQEVRTVISHCPHCLQTIKDGYLQVDPDFDVEVIHHSELLAKLLAEGKLKSRSLGGEGAKVTIHDPCYVSRWKIGDLDGIRSIVHGAGMNVTEMDYSKERSFCCGSGGGSHHFFEDKDQKRIDTERIKQIQQVGAEIVITACPFCNNMISEGLKSDESERAVVDISAFLEAAE